MARYAREVTLFKVFVASPGDMREERLSVYEAVQSLMYEPSLRGRVATQVVAWDGPYCTVPLTANVDPQAAIEQGLPRPSECEVVVVLLWGRMGTPLGDEYRKPDGSGYRSGTEWEYLDAIRTAEERGTPTVLVYQRTQPPSWTLDQSPAALAEAKAQYDAVQDFFQELRSQNRGFNTYLDPLEFAKLFGSHLTQTIYQALNSENDIVRLLMDSDPGARAALDEKQIGEAMLYAQDLMHSPHLRRMCVEGVRCWLADSDPRPDCLEEIKHFAMNLESDLEIEVSKAAVGIIRSLAERGLADSRDLLPAVRHPAWEVGTAAVAALTSISDDYVFQTASDIKLSYWLPLGQLADNARDRAEALTEDELSCAITLLARLAERPKVSDKTRKKLVATVDVLGNLERQGLPTTAEPDSD